MCLAVVHFLPTGTLLAYTDLDWQTGLTMQSGHMMMVSRVNMMVSRVNMMVSPQHQLILARAVILSLSQENTARLHLLEHSM